MVGLNVGNVIAVLNLDSRQFDAALKTSQQRLTDFAHKMGKMGSYLTLRLTLPLAYFGKKATESFAAFDDAITRSTAVTRGMTIALRKEMVDTALEISKKSILSATELAEGYFALGQAGYAAAQSVKVLPVVEEFAVASSTTLDKSIRYLSRTVEGLGMASEDPIEMMEAMTEASNAFTFAAITTTAEIEDFAVAMTHAAAPALRLVNKSMAEGTAVLMAFARAGIVAEEAGTLLWTTVRDLQRANIKAHEQWERMGLEIYDTSGKMRNLAEIFSDLEGKFSGFSDQGKKVALMLLGFQDRSLRGIQALMGFSEEMKIFQREMEKGGDITHKVAETYKKSFSAQLKIARHHIDALRISIGWTLSPILTKLIEKIKAVANWWESLSDNTRLIVVEFGILLAVVGPLLLIFEKLVLVIVGISTGFAGLIVSAVKLVGSFAVVVAGAMGVVAAIGLIVALAYTVRAVWKQTTGHVKDNLVLFADIFKLVYEYIGKVFKGFIGWFVKGWHNMLDSARRDFGNFAKDAGGIVRAIGAIFKGEDPWVAFTEGWEHTEKELEKMKGFVGDVFDDAGIYAAAWAEAFKENVGEVEDAIKKQLGEDAGAVIEGLKDKFAKMNEELLKMLPAQEMRDILDTLTKTAKKISELGDEPGFDIWTRHLDAATLLSERFREVAIRAFDDISDAITEMVTTGKADLKSLAATILTDVLRAIIRAKMALIWTERMEPWLSAVGAGVGNLFKGLFNQTPGGGWAGMNEVSGMNVATPQGTFYTAMGRAFSNGRIIPLGLGDIINQAMLLPLRSNKAAMIGERGPEAVVPLTRTPSGELGVKSMGSPVENKIKIINVTSDEAVLAAMQTDAGEKLIMNYLRKNGVI